MTPPSPNHPSVKSNNPCESVIQTPSEHNNGAQTIVVCAWSVSPLSAVADVRDGTHESPQYHPTGVPFVTSKNIVDGQLDLNDVSFISKDDARDFNQRSRVDKGDILMSMIGTIGDVVIVDFDPGFCIKNVALIKPTDVLGEYLVQFLGSPGFQKRLANQLDGGIQKFISLGKLRRVSIPLPPLPEQRAIAEVLSDVDALIAALDTLIAKKRAIKQGAMQALLTGKTRLPGFSGEWHEVSLKDIADIDVESLSSNTDREYSFNYISLEDVDRGILRGSTKMLFADAPSRARRIVRQNDILVSTVRPNLKSHLYVTDAVSDTVCSTGFSVVRCKLDIAEPAFVFYQLFSDQTDQQIQALLVGSNYPAINSGDVRKLLLGLPPLPEQRAIAAVLSDMDAEIDALVRRRDKTKALKQGMMQELLTGRTRLI
jgi:type I restriction enzyme, S subunit